MTTGDRRDDICTGIGYGKLMIAGEYSVTRSRRRAIVMGVNRGITARTTPSMSKSVSLQYNQRSETIRIEKLCSTDYLHYVSPDNSYALHLVAKIANLAQSMGVRFTGAKIAIDSDLDDPLLRVKYGLGGSSAVAASLAVSLDAYLGLALDRDRLWKLSYLATIETNPQASGADLAAALYGGWVHYRSPDREWLTDKIDNTELRALICADWPGLEIERLTRPPDAGALVVGWSGTPATTADLVTAARSRISNDFLEHSDRTVAGLSKALSTADYSATAHYVRQAQAHFEDLDSPPVGILTDNLRTMILESSKLGVPAKVSGAGGGDCCIAFPSDIHHQRALTQRWNDLGFPVLPLSPAPEAEAPE